ncbi:fimbria/pilus outer membrane usher protein [Vibrio sagamiensis]|uniref:Outer membrane usher protein PapC n=1 Tax=Vibrio sagamiensis NBRC 104589 TaxID=1219064 RepID=A0A511QHA3_9VIBR|nr:fimbria/pilus outer membrane usher protein [Vibrio sagamiensis]GEM76567.1 outer membrane usher protein PapC [Vibrio sagamiensis NBRC 104589]
MKLYTRKKLIVLSTFFVAAANATEFNLDFIDANDRSEINFERFSNEGYILPGLYTLKLLVNGERISTAPVDVEVKEIDNGEGATFPCLDQNSIKNIGLKNNSNIIEKFKEKSCLNINKLPIIDYNIDLYKQVININIDKNKLEYSERGWLSYKHWDEGINGITLDYRINSLYTSNQNKKDTYSSSVSGTAGLNFDAWRIRANYNGDIAGSDIDSEGIDFQQIYAYRALGPINSKLFIGERFLSSEIFQPYSFTGISLKSDERMRPPRLRDYAPRIQGIAKTNAKVEVYRGKYLIYETNVAAGEFEINDLNSVQGILDVKVIEQNGDVASFTVGSDTIPYLLRPGTFNYSLNAGKTDVAQDSSNDLSFVTAEIEYGYSNNITLHTGTTLSEDYRSWAFGFGTNLGTLGSASLDMLTSNAEVDNSDNDKTGNSFKLAYAKNFSELDTSINFSGYQFFDRNYYSLPDLVSYLDNSIAYNNTKSIISANINHNIDVLNSSISVQYSNFQYWDDNSAESYNISLGTSFDAFGIKYIKANLSATRSLTESSTLISINKQKKYETSYFFNLSIPLDIGYVSYNTNIRDEMITHNVTYSGRLADSKGNYSLRAGYNQVEDGENAQSFGTYLSYDLPYTGVNLNSNYVKDDYLSVGASLDGGLTFSKYGFAANSGGYGGSTRLIIDTNGYEDVPISGSNTKTNSQGLAVISNISSYRVEDHSVDMSQLPDTLDAKQPHTETILTEGAIGYRSIKVIKGHKAFLEIELKDGGVAPFGATLNDKEGLELGIIGDDGIVWATGFEASQTLSVNFYGQQCHVQTPESVDVNKVIHLKCL